MCRHIILAQLAPLRDALLRSEVLCEIGRLLFILEGINASSTIQGERGYHDKKKLYTPPHNRPFFEKNKIKR